MRNMLSMLCVLVTTRMIYRVKTGFNCTYLHLSVVSHMAVCTTGQHFILCVKDPISSAISHGLHAAAGVCNSWGIVSPCMILYT